MIYRGYRIVKAAHPTPVQPKRTTYDIQHDGEVLRANIATIDMAKLIIDLMVKLRRWENRDK